MKKTPHEAWNATAPTPVLDVVSGGPEDQLDDLMGHIVRHMSIHKSRNLAKGFSAHDSAKAVFQVC